MRVLRLRERTQKLGFNFVSQTLSAEASAIRSTDKIGLANTDVDPLKNDKMCIYTFGDVE